MSESYIKTETIKEKKIVLISVYNQFSSAIRYIHSQLLGNGFDVYMIYFGDYDDVHTIFPSKKDYNLLIELLNEVNPKVIGISSATFAFSITKKIINKIKGNTDAKIILGGLHTRIKPEECIKYSDIVCIGEGEECFTELCKRLFKKEDYYDIPNFWIKKGNKIIKNPIKSVENLDKLFLPDFKSKKVFYIENKKIVKGKWLMHNKRGFRGLGVMIGRGCPFRCTYCVNSTLKVKVRTRKVDNVIKELKFIKEYFKDIKHINFLDEIFPSDEKWLNEFCKRYKEEINIPFKCQLHPSFINEKIVSSLKDIGMYELMLGIQSGSQRFREEVYRRYTSNGLLRNVINSLKRHNIYYACDVIINNPLETNEDLRESITFLLSLPRPLHIHLYSLTNLPKTELTEKLLREGIIKKPVEKTKDFFGFGFSKYHPFENNKHEYWFYIFNFLRIKFIPKSLILFLTKNIFVKHPLPLIKIFRIGNKIYRSKDNKGGVFTQASNGVR